MSSDVEKWKRTNCLPEVIPEKVDGATIVKDNVILAKLEPSEVQDAALSAALHKLLEEMGTLPGDFSDDIYCQAFLSAMQSVKSVTSRRFTISTEWDEIRFAHHGAVGAHPFEILSGAMRQSTVSPDMFVSRFRILGKNAQRRHMELVLDDALYLMHAASQYLSEHLIDKTSTVQDALDMVETFAEHEVSEHFKGKAEDMGRAWREDKDKNFFVRMWTGSTAALREKQDQMHATHAEALQYIADTKETFLTQWQQQKDLNPCVDHVVHVALNFMKCLDGYLGARLSRGESRRFLNYRPVETCEYGEAPSPRAILMHPNALGKIARASLFYARTRL